ncbi:3-hydroxyacyl-CoA dehydrogenase type-2-like [Oppia nitens]|uniref:3-hydroxyacyl-CoA dehydrogenase type-2-like n=1 Tax=Oppia nitens TaxID=1686743 RepID=UPI0023DA5742|nr:3-hydroxyacyl-CoA dehydrogenase type-2-like [Oppia nitens]
MLSCLVTGGHSGLGRAVCQRFARAGHRVVSLDLMTEDKTEDNVQHIRGDVRNEADVQKAISRLPKIDCLVSCSGVANAFKIFNFESKRPQRLEDFKTLLEINVFGTFNVLRLVAHKMAQNQTDPNGQRGSIILTSSILATDAHEGQTGTAASSAALNSMTLPLARDLKDVGIRVNTIAVGFFATPLVERSESQELLSFIRLATPCPSRLGDPEEFAHLAERLIRNPMINGSIIRLDGACRWPERG